MELVANSVVFINSNNWIISKPVNVLKPHNVDSWNDCNDCSCCNVACLGNNFYMYSPFQQEILLPIHFKTIASVLLVSLFTNIHFDWHHKLDIKRWRQSQRWYVNKHTLEHANPGYHCLLLIGSRRCNYSSSKIFDRSGMVIEGFILDFVSFLSSLACAFVFFSFLTHRHAFFWDSRYVLHPNIDAPASIIWVTSWHATTQQQHTNYHVIASAVSMSAMLTVCWPSRVTGRCRWKVDFQKYLYSELITTTTNV